LECKDYVSGIKTAHVIKEMHRRYVNVYGQELGKMCQATIPLSSLKELMTNIEKELELS
jgi:hypothetical protein